ncbi:flagellar biosynthetic protein FliO [Neptunicella marina]|uniref:Flagellar protein n=1 Tax=Neptunicella marina TaxID=2125989 RepID=A0A8J6LXT0_9ALTE|nr:flagellar biosynthetic protein FliO [Neptunicella marina]MBC3764990.1 flagellar biosynthetic protein FliO [Neptunicella marina]
MLLVKSKELKNSVNFLFRPLAGGLFLLSPAVFAESATPTTASSFVSILLSLIVVLAIIFSLGYLMRRFNVTHTGSHQMKIVSSMMLGNRERVMLIQVGEEQHLLGVTAQQINHLSKLETPVITDESAESFKQKLGHFMKNNKEANHD